MVQTLTRIDPTRRELAYFSRLTEPDSRNRRERETGIFLAESEVVIDLALRAGCRPLALLMEQKQLDGVSALLARCGGTPVFTGAREVLASLTGFVLHRSILCAMERPAPLTPAQVCAHARRIAVLEALDDATAMGALFRSAAALGMDGILLTPACADPLCRRTVRVSMGSVFQVPWAVLPQWPFDLHELGFETVAVSFGERHNTVPRDRPLAILLRSDGETLLPSALPHDHTLAIPLSHGVESLNIVTAGAVVFWELGEEARKR